MLGTVSHERRQMILSSKATRKQFALTLAKKKVQNVFELEIMQQAFAMLVSVQRDRYVQYLLLALCSSMPFKKNFSIEKKTQCCGCVLTLCQLLMVVCFCMFQF